MNTATLDRQQVASMAPAQEAPKANVVPFAASAAPKSYPPAMVKAVLAVTREIGAIAKDGWNDFHKYKYLKWDDVLDRISVLLPKHGLILTPSEISRSLVENDQAKNDQLVGITYEFILVHEDGDEWPVRPRITAFGRVRDSKNVCDDKAAAKCLTQAEKYFLIHFFKIRTSDVIDSDADGSQVEQQQPVASPKPPKPGSVEAKTLERPRSIPMQGHSAESWADAFIFAIENASLGEIDMWREENRNALGALEKYPEPTAKVKKAIAGRTAALAPQNAPKPPRPGATAPVAPKSNPMPDPAEQPAEFIAWLAAKFDVFETYEAGETYWNETVEALDLAPAIQEDAMAIWQKFDARHAP